MSLIKSAIAYYHKHLHWGITPKIQKLFIKILFSIPICIPIPYLNRIPVFIYLLTGPGQPIYASWKELVRDIIYVINIDGKTKLDWTERKNELDRTYKDIRLHPIANSRIGCFIIQAVCEWHEGRKRKDNDILHLYIATSRLGNARVEKIIARKLNLLANNEEKYFWIYYIFHLNKKIKNEDIISEWETSLEPSAPHEITPSWTMQYITMTDEEEREGGKKAREMGLTGEFVCIANRESAFDAKERPGSLYALSEVVRNSDIYTRADAAQYLSTRNIQCVRMGSVVAQRADFPNCRDYASDFYDELMDVWLAKHCKFWVSDEFGINLLPRAMNKRCVTTNFIHCTAQITAGIPMRDDSIYIIKRYRSMEDGRMLTLEEMAEVYNLMIRLQGNLAQNVYEIGIEFVDNTPTEIMEAVREMNERMDGTWTETAEDRALQDRYQSKLRDLYRRYGNDLGVTFGLIGTQFLRNHIDLLDHVDSKFMHLCD